MGGVNIEGGGFNNRKSPDSINDNNMHIWNVIINYYSNSELRIISRKIEQFSLNKIPGQYSIISELPYSYDDALKQIRDLGYAGKHYIYGITYGVIPEVTNGYAVSEVRNSIKLRSRCCVM